MVPRNWSRTQWWSANTSLFCDKMIQYHLWRTMMGFPGHKTQIYVWGPTHQPYNPIIWAILWILYIIPYTIYVSISRAILYHMIKEKTPMIVEISNDGLDASLNHHLIFLDSYYRGWAADQMIFVQGIIFGANILSKVTIVSVIQEEKNRHSGNDEIWQIYSYFDIFANICLSFISIFFSMNLNLTSGTLKVNFSNHSFLSHDDHSSQKFPQVPKLSITKFKTGFA